MRVNNCQSGAIKSVLGGSTTGTCVGVKTTFGFPLGVSTLENLDVFLARHAQRKACLGRQTACVAINQHSFVLRDA